MALAADFRVHLESLRKLAAMHPTDTFYAHAAEQVAAIVTGLEERAALPTAPPTVQKGT